MCIYIYFIKTIIIQKRKQKMKRDRQPERETDESQLIGFSSWFYGPERRSPTIGRRARWGADVTQTASY